MASSIEGKLSPEDIQLLIESMGYWETAGNQDFHMMHMVKSAVMPDDDDDSFEFVKRVKDHFAGREREIVAAKNMRQEKATLLKARLMLMRQDMGVDQLFDQAGEDGVTSSSSPVTDSMPQPVAAVPGDSPVVDQEEPDNPELLAKAESFMEKHNILGHYNGYLTNEGKETSFKLAKQYLEECGLTSHFDDFLKEN